MSTSVALAAAEAVEQWLAASGLEVESVTRPGSSAVGWFTMLQGERKRTIPLYLELGSHTLIVESHFMRGPDENEAALYGYLLRRNLRTYTLRFALYDTGDVMIVGVVPLHAVTVDELDRVAGQLLTTADEAFNEALRLGFTSYIDREQAWRERVGLGRNPIS